MTKLTSLSLIFKMVFACLSSVALADELKWPQSVCHEQIQEDCPRGFASVSLKFKQQKEKNYCVAKDFWAIEYFPDRLDEELKIGGYDEFSPPLKITPRLMLYVVCEIEQKNTQ